MAGIRTPLAVTFSVWKALTLREALSRLFAGRASWFWLLFEPVFHVSYLIFIYTVIRMRTVGGIDVVIWLIAGMLGFFMFRRTANQASNGVGANRALFAYRQVKPVDTVLVRGLLEGVLTAAVACILLCAAALFGHDALPDAPLSVFEAFFGLWLLGMGFGLVMSVVTELLPEVGRIISLVMKPLYVISGVIVPLMSIPQPYREWLLLNPIAHGLEAARLGFSPYYHAVPELDIGYLYFCALVLIVLGLALHRRFATRLVTQ